MEVNLERFKGASRETYELEVLTPMFLGGANPLDAELRAPSVKGMLRFWWRATYDTDNVETMGQQEDKIFGSTEMKASFSISVSSDNEIRHILPFDIYKKKSEHFIVHSHRAYILDYLSYGTYTYKKEIKQNKYNKYHIPPGSKFKIKFSFHSSQYRDEIIKAFKCLLTFGGLGAKNRNGFGSIYCKDINTDLDIKRFNNKNLRDYTSFSKKSKIFIFSEQTSWEEAISEIGMAYHDGRTSIEKHHVYDKRALIAAPLQVRNRNHAHKNEERHAKPYFMKVQKLQNGKFLGIITYIPYNYYDKSKHEEYKSACVDINNIIQTKAKGGLDDTKKA